MPGDENSSTAGGSPQVDSDQREGLHHQYEEEGEEPGAQGVSHVLISV